MNWRRGLVLAGLNLLAAVPLICLLEVRTAQYLKESTQGSSTHGAPWIDSSGNFSIIRAELVQVQAQEEQTVEFSPCGLWAHYPPQVSVVQAGNLPAWMLTQWNALCPPKWSIAGKMGIGANGAFSNDFAARQRLDVYLCILIALQWFLIGSFPLTKSDRWWKEPDSFITGTTFFASCIAIVPVIDRLSELPAMMAIYAWLWWTGLLIWVLIRFAWRSTLGGMRRLSN